MLLIRNEQPSDGAHVEALLDAAFGPDRHSKISYRYRRQAPCVRELCLVAEEAGRIVGTIRYWPVHFEQEPALLLGPVATDPTRRAVGIGRALVFESLARAADLGWHLVFLVGDRDYYRRFGFEVVPPTIVMPGEQPTRVQWRRLDGRPILSAAGEIRRYDGSRIEPVAERPPDRELVQVESDGVSRGGTAEFAPREARAGTDPLLEHDGAGSDDHRDGGELP